MCKCKIGECVYANCQHADGIIECEKLGNIIPKKSCSEFIQFVEIEEEDTELNYSRDAHVKCPECNEINDLYDIPYDKYIEVVCKNCETKFGCEYYYD